MKILYRPQRGVFLDSLKDAKEFSNLKEMFEYLVKERHEAFSVREIYISYYIFDDRIDSDVYAVTVKRYFKTNFLKRYKCPQIIGFCSFIKGG